MNKATSKEKAWVGDSVLSLYVRRWILEQPNIAQESRSDVYKHFTSNQFLSAFGNPTEVEAKLGLLYENKGLPEAFDYITQNILPVFKKQRQNIKKRHPRTSKRL